MECYGIARYFRSSPFAMVILPWSKFHPNDSVVPSAVSTDIQILCDEVLYPTVKFDVYSNEGTWDMESLTPLLTRSQ